MIFCFCFGAVVALISIFMVGGTDTQYAPGPGARLASKDEIPSRILGSLVVGAIAAIFICFYKSNKVPRVVCPECGVTKTRMLRPNVNAVGTLKALMR